MATAIDPICAALETAIDAAATSGARWIVTPELCLTGYRFDTALGTAWIRPLDEDPWVQRVRARAMARGVTAGVGAGGCAA